MFESLEELAAQKSVILIASNSDGNAIPSIHFARELDTSAPNQKIGCRTINFEENGTVITSLPVIFDIICRISRSDCYLTVQGDKQQCQPGEGDPVMSGWLEPCPDSDSKFEWSRMIRRLKHIMNDAQDNINVSELFRYNEEAGYDELQISKGIQV